MLFHVYIRFAEWAGYTAHTVKIINYFIQTCIIVHAPYWGPIDHCIRRLSNYATPSSTHLHRPHCVHTRPHDAYPSALFPPKAKNKKALIVKALKGAFPWCPEQDSNLHALNGHKALNLACLPIPPSGHFARQI